MLEVYVTAAGARERCIRYMADYSPVRGEFVGSRSYFVAEEQFFRPDERLIRQVDARPIAYRIALAEVMEITAADRKEAAELLAGDYSGPEARPEDVHRVHIDRDSRHNYTEPFEEQLFTVRWDGLVSYPHRELIEAMAAATTISENGMQANVVDESTGVVLAIYHLADTLYLHSTITSHHDPDRIAF